MSTLDVLLRLRAVADGHAQPRTLYRHRHLDRKPLVVVAYRLAGESVAPLALRYGTTRSRSNLLVAPEPRNREIRFREVFDPFASDLCDLVADRAADIEGTGWQRTSARCPQIIVPNGATADFVAPLIGRSLRYLRTEGDYAVPAATVEAGAHLTWMGQQAEMPGSSVVLSATDLLRRHWTTGLSDLESEDLHVQLAWIDPPTGTDGASAAEAAERARGEQTLPGAGPTPDPEWDRDILEPLIEAFNHARDGKQDAATVTRLGKGMRKALRSALEPAWEATWQAIDLVRQLPEAPSVAKRWAEDRRSFAYHYDRVQTGDARFRIRDSVKQSAMAVRRQEDAQAQLDASEALDDPLVMAAAIADGTAFAGTVTTVDGYDITVEVDRPCPIPTGTELKWTDLPDKASVIVEAASGEPPFRVEVRAAKGRTKYLPEVGDQITYSPFGPPTFRAPSLPDLVPWTHLGAESVPRTPEVQE